MTDAAAFRACYTDWRLIKGRKVVQVVLEIPIEQSDLAYRALNGMPDPGESVWVAVARLDPERAAAPQVITPASPAAREPEPPGRSYAFEAVRLCEKPGFQRWCMVEWPNEWRELEGGHPEEKAREIVCLQCGVTSRGDLREGTEAGEKWKRLKLRYEQPGLAA